MSFMSQHAASVRHPNFNNLASVKLGKDAEFQKALQNLFAYHTREMKQKGAVAPETGPTLPSTLAAMNPTLPKAGSGKTLSPLASEMMTGGPPTQAPMQQQQQAPPRIRVGNIFTQPQQPQAQAPQPQMPAPAPAPQAPPMPAPAPMPMPMPMAGGASPVAM